MRLRHRGSKQRKVDGARQDKTRQDKTMARAHRLVNLVRVTGTDVDANVRAHGFVGPLFKHRAVRRLGGVVDEPSGGVAHFV